MKTKPSMKYISSLLLLAILFICSCKKKDPEPNPTANTDNVVMADINLPQTVDVLTNDTYNGTPSIHSASTDSKYGTVVINSDKTITYTPFLNFFGTAVVNYTLKDDNGTANGSVLIKRGTAAQERTYTIINDFLPVLGGTVTGIFLYSIDGDSSAANIYAPHYGQYGIDYSAYFSRKLGITSKGVMPNIGDNTYTIAADGNVVVKANDNSTVVFEVVDYFTASAKKQNFIGEMTVKGYTIRYNGHTLAYTTEVL